MLYNVGVVFCNKETENGTIFEQKGGILYAALSLGSLKQQTENG